MINEQAKKLGEGLIAAKILTQEQLNTAIQMAEKKSAPSLVVALLQKDFLTYQIFEKFVTKSMGMKSAIIANRKHDSELIKKLGEDYIKKQFVFPISEKANTLVLGMVDPLDQETIDFLEKKIKVKISPVLISLPDFQQTLKNITEKMVVVRPGGYEEEIAFQMEAEKTKTTAKSPHGPTIEMNPGSASNVTEKPLIGIQNKKFKEEAIAKLDLKGTQVKALKFESYTRDLLFNDLVEINPKHLETIYDSLSASLKVEALANVLIKLGILTKRDLIISGAVSHVFAEKEQTK